MKHPTTSRIKIIPAIDLIGGKCVRLSRGDYSQQRIYNEDPLEVARMFEDAGITRLHLVDLDGAKARHIVNYKVLGKIASSTRLTIDFGGGLKSDKDLNIAFENGASMITGGSIAVHDKALFFDWLSRYGAEKIILGADAKDRKIAVSGWQEISELPIQEFIDSFVQKGIRKVISTDIDCDGMLCGPSFGLYSDLLDHFPDLELIASGGISTIDDIYRLEEMGVPAVIIGKAIYEKRIQLKEIEKFYQ